MTRKPGAEAARPIADDPAVSVVGTVGRMSTGGWWLRLRGRSWWVSGPVLLYVFLVLLGVTQSSIGIGNLREDPASPTGIMIGSGVAIRSDEYLTSTPILLGAAATGSADDFNPLTAEQGFSTQVPSGPVSALVLFDGAALRLGPLLPDQMLLAARWWLPFLLLALGAPVYFRSLTGSKEVGLLAALLVVVSPASAWWSATPVAIVGFAMAGSAALLRCRDLLVVRQVPRALAWGAGAAVLLARIPLLYQPWSIVISLAVVAVAVVPVVLDRTTRRATLLAVGGVGVMSLLLVVGVVLENIEGVIASLGTVYPGARVASGSSNPLQEVFAATSLGDLTRQDLVGTNASEISSSFAVAGLWAILLLVVGVQFRDRVHRLATVTALAFTGFWFAWCLVDFGTWATRIPLLNRVPSSRAADVVGYLAILLLCLVLPALTRRIAVRTGVLIAASVALLAAYAGSQLRMSSVPTLPVAAIWVSSLLLGAVVLTVTLRPRWWVGYAAAVVLDALLIWNVNPVLFGLADLRGSDVAHEMLQTGRQARGHGDLWASDDLSLDALFAATGVPSLSSRQLAGPDRETWEKLDPAPGDEDVWNRGGAYITFVWTADDALTFANPVPDVIRVSGSPCALADRVARLESVVATHELDGECLRDAGTFMWGGTTRWVYRLTD